MINQPPQEATGLAQWILLRLKPFVDDDAASLFADEAEEGAVTAGRPWSILIVDDDSEVHAAIGLALSGAEIDGRRLRLSHCHSASEARTRLAGDEEDIDLVLLDVVMESAEAGLDLLESLRAEPETRSLPVLIHTGQAGRFSENMVRARYDISGYLPKSSVTQQGLLSALRAVLQEGRAA
ncbi:response regulator [Dongia sp.]|uniref:response regulator n=1 Tax=Dongia sp. TaxID=1977262 RepID=UPI0035B1F0C1